MKSIYKILIAFLAITMVASGVSAFEFPREDYGLEDGYSDKYIPGEEKGIGYDQIGNQPRPYSDTGIEYRDTITSAHGGIRLPTMGEVEEIEETLIHPVPPCEVPVGEIYASLVIDHF